MKNLLFANFVFCTIFFFAPNSITGQIQSGGFEDWEMIENYYEPLGWDTEQNTLLQRIFMDTLSVDGDFSIRMESNPEESAENCRSQIDLSQNIGPQENIGSVSFWLRLLPQANSSGVFFSFFLRPKLNGQSMSPAIWQTTTEYQEFTYIEVPLGNSAFDEIYIEIVAGPIPGSSGDCSSYTSAWVDDLELNVTTATEDATKSDFVLLSPNPSNGQFFLSGNDGIYDQYAVMNSLGGVVEYGKIVNNNISIKEKGIFFVKLLSSSDPKLNSVQKVVVISN